MGLEITLSLYSKLIVMKFTKEQRLKIYKEMLLQTPTKGYQKYLNFGLCAMGVEVIQDLHREFFSYRQLHTELPEIFTKQPEIWEGGMYWFSLTFEGWEKRSEILRQCIKELS